MSSYINKEAIERRKARKAVEESESRVVNNEALERRKSRLEAKEKAGKCYDGDGNEYDSPQDMLDNVNGFEGDLLRAAAANGGKTTINGHEMDTQFFKNTDRDDDLDTEQAYDSNPFEDKGMSRESAAIFGDLFKGGKL